MSYPEIVQPKEIQEIPGVLRIGVDLDGNVDDLIFWFNRLAKRGLGIDVQAKLNEGPVNFWVTEWEEIKKIPGGIDFVNQIFENQFIYENAPPISGAIETLNRWRVAGHQIWFITARPEENLGQVTLDWLKKHNLDWGQERVFFSKGDRIDFKSQQAEKLRLHVFIDDHADSTREAFSPTMMVKLVLKYPWNMAEDIGSQAVYVDNWFEIDQAVQMTGRWHYFLFSQK